MKSLENIFKNGTCATLHRKIWRSDDSMESEAVSRAFEMQRLVIVQQFWWTLFKAPLKVYQALKSKFGYLTCTPNIEKLSIPRKFKFYSVPGSHAHLHSQNLEKKHCFNENKFRRREETPSKNNKQWAKICGSRFSNNTLLYINSRTCTFQNSNRNSSRCNRYMSLHPTGRTVTPGRRKI